MSTLRFGLGFVIMLSSVGVCSPRAYADDWCDKDAPAAYPGYESARLGLEGRCQRPPEPEDDSDPAYERYGLTMLLVDGVTIAAAALTENGYVFAIGYLVGGPTVHYIEGGDDVVVWSLGLRAALPLAGAFLGTRSYEDEDALAGVFLGGGLGLLTAYTIDWVVLARRPLAPPGAADATSSSSSESSLSFAPVFSAGDDHIEMGIVGRF